MQGRLPVEVDQEEGEIEEGEVGTASPPPSAHYPHPRMSAKQQQRQHHPRDRSPAYSGRPGALHERGGGGYRGRDSRLGRGGDFEYGDGPPPSFRGGRGGGGLRGGGGYVGSRPRGGGGGYGNRYGGQGGNNEEELFSPAGPRGRGRVGGGSRGRGRGEMYQGPGGAPYPFGGVGGRRGGAPGMGPQGGYDDYGEEFYPEDEYYEVCVCVRVFCGRAICEEAKRGEVM